MDYEEMLERICDRIADDIRHQVLNGKLDSVRETVSKARRVFPIPPGPRMVSRHTSGSANNVSSSTSSALRPTKGVGCTGRLCRVSTGGVGVVNLPVAGGAMRRGRYGRRSPGSMTDRGPWPRSIRVPNIASNSAPTSRTLGTRCRRSFSSIR